LGGSQAEGGPFVRPGKYFFRRESTPTIHLTARATPALCHVIRDKLNWPSGGRIPDFRK
jgi:hypothetical protein